MRKSNNKFKGIDTYQDCDHLSKRKALRLFRLVFCIFCLFAITGCAHIPGGVAPSNIPIDGREYYVIGHAKATDSVVRLLGIIPLSGSNSLSSAVQECIVSRGGDAMIGITAESYSQFWILFTRDIIMVEGDVIRFKK